MNIISGENELLPGGMEISKDISLKPAGKLLINTFHIERKIIQKEIHF